MSYDQLIQLNKELDLYSMLWWIKVLEPQTWGACYLES